MNPIFGTILLFGSIFLVFFGLPIGFLAISSIIFPPNLETPEPVKEIIHEEVNEIIEDHPDVIPIEVQQVYHKGYLVCVDA